MPKLPGGPGPGGPGDGPHLTLPPRDRLAAGPPARPRRAAPLLVGSLLAAVLGLQVYGLLRPEPPPPALSGRRPLLPPAELREVAVRLRRDNLHSAAAAAYDEYLAAAEIDDGERGNLLLETGNLLARAGRYEEALARYVRAERLVGESNLAPLRRRIQECLQRLGKHAEQAYELSDGLAPRAGGGGGKTAGDQQAGKVVAWIGPEKITASDLDDLIAREVEERAAAIPGLPQERVAELKAQAQKQLASPQSRLGKLREFLAREVLYREGQEREVEKSGRVQRRMEDFRREVVIEETVLSSIRDRIKVSEGDLRNYYQANPARYRERPSARARIAVFADEAKAREALAAVKTEEDFARVAREGSLEPSTRERGGLLDRPVVEGEPLPVLGPAPELARAILETRPPGPIARPVKVAAGEAAGFALAFVVERSPERTPSYEEVRERVGRDYLDEKQAEVQSDLVRELFQKHGVSVATEEFLPGAAGTAPAADPAPPPKQP